MFAKTWAASANFAKKYLFKPVPKEMFLFLLFLYLVKGLQLSFDPLWRACSGKDCKVLTMIRKGGTEGNIFFLLLVSKGL
jgi:hypothetical protein